MRFPIEIVRRMREAVGPDFIIIYRLSMLDLVDGGQTWDEVVALAQGRRGRRRDDHQHRHRLARGAHPDDRHQRAARRPSAGSTRKLRAKSRIPLVTTNRINMPEVAEAHARATATPTWCRWRARSWPTRTWVSKAAAGPRRRDQHLHRLQPGLPGPHLQQQARQLPGQPARLPRDRADDRRRPRARKRVAVVGAGPAGLAAATSRPSAATPSTLFDARRRDRRPVQHGQAHSGQGGVRRDAALLQPPARTRPAWSVRLDTRVDAAALRRGRLRRGGARHRRRAARPRIPGADQAEGAALHRRAARHGQPVGERVAIIGAGGIGFDVAEFLSDGARPRAATDIARWT